MFDVFLNVMLPVFLVALVAAICQRWRKLSVQSLSQLTLYLFTPALIFYSLLTTDVDATVFSRVAAAYVITSALLLATSTLISKLLRQPRDLQSAFILSAIFPNVGNTGLPVTLLAFGQEGLTIAVIIVVAQSFVSASLGTFVAARSTMAGLQPLLQVFKLPSLYSAIAAVVVKGLGWELPTPINEPIRLLSQAAIPTMLAVLGFQLAAGVKLEQPGSVVAALFVRLIVAAPLGYIAGALMGLDGVAHQTLTVMAAMPTAVFTIILSTEFKARPAFVTSVVVTSAVVGLATLSGIITAARQFIS